MPSHADRNNVLAGAFLLSALALFIATSFIIRQIQLEPRSTYVVRFSLATGAQGLAKGSVVRLGGQAVGEVDEVRFAPSEQSPEFVDVEVEIDEDIVLFENAGVYLQRQLLGSGSDLNIASVGDPDTLDAGALQDGDPRLGEGETVMGRAAPPSFLADAGWGENESQALPRIVRNVEETTADARDFMAETRAWWGQTQPTIDRSLENFESLSAEARALGEDLPGHREEIDRIVANTNAFTERFGGFMDRADGVADNANAGVDQLRGVFADLDAVVDRNAPEIAATVDASRDTAERLRDVTVPELEQGADEFEEAFARLEEVIAASAPLVRGTLANARIAADQLKLATIEVRQQPWRVFLQPTEKELNRQLLYDAARTYATSVGDLRAASESLEGLLAGEGAARVRTESINQITDEIREAFTRYQEAEQLLLDRLIQEQK
ncbi:MAG: hypothetical protein AAF138_05175 [Planctomycetota bacterium]